METIGGQAVIEGVMLRRKNVYSIAVRDPKKRIIVSKHKIRDHRKGLLRIFKYPFFRGIYSMYEMLHIGIRTLIYSSNVSMNEDEEKLSKSEIFWLIFISLLFTVGFFVVLPYFLTLLVGVQESTRPVIFNLIDALIKTVLFVLYVLAIAQMKDIKRVFQYHGAEHKTVHCYEKRLKLTVKNVKKHTTLHPRCGSSFIMLVIVISIIVFSLLPLAFYSWFPALISMHIILQKVFLLSARILVIPIIAGMSYEILKLAGKYDHNPLMRLISWPGLALQKLTTAEPSEKQIEVAIKAIKVLLTQNKAKN